TLNTRAREDLVVQRAQARAGSQRLAAGQGKRVTQPGDDLGHRQIDVADPCPDHVAVAGRIASENLLEIPEKLRQTVLPERGRASLRFGLLLLVVKATSHRVMGVMDLDDEVFDRQLQLMRPSLCG